jgi:hypothetical protein
MTKLGLGIAGVALAWLFAWGIAGLPITPLGLWLSFYVLQDFSYGALIEPPVQALVSRDSPPQVLSLMMAFYRAAAGGAYFLAGWLDRFYEPMGPANPAPTTIASKSLPAIGLSRVAGSHHTIVSGAVPGKIFARKGAKKGRRQEVLPAAKRQNGSHEDTKTRRWSARFAAPRNVFVSWCEITYFRLRRVLCAFARNSHPQARGLTAPAPCPAPPGRCRGNRGYSAAPGSRAA